MFLKSSLKNSIQNSIEEVLEVSHRIEALEYHLYLKTRPLEKLELIDAQIAKKNKNIYFGKKVPTHVLEVSTHEESVQKID